MVKAGPLDAEGEERLNFPGGEFDDVVVSGVPGIPEEAVGGGPC